MRKSYLMICLFITVLCFLNHPAVGGEGFKEIKTLDLKKWMDAEDKPILINSLSPIEFGESYIPGSISIPMELMQVSQSMPADPAVPLVFYSYGPGCMKAKNAANTAFQMGYQNVYWYREGIEGWKKAGYSTQYNLKLPEEPLPPKEPTELFQQLQNKEKVILIDIRDEITRKKQGRIGGITIQLPLYRLHNLYGELPNDKPLVVYDSNGLQSLTACRYLYKRHFDKVTWLNGGLEAWKRKKLPVE